MIAIADILYFTSTDVKLHPIARSLYAKNPRLFAYTLTHIFDFEYQNKIRALVGMEEIEDTEQKQVAINAVMEELLLLFHRQLSTPGRSFLHAKGITDDQIDQYRLGDSAALTENASVVFKVFSDRHPSWAIELAVRALQDYRSEINSRYSSTHFISLPSFSKERVNGAVFRTTKFEKREGQLRNMFKFYSPYNCSFLFNEDALLEHDELYLVEGVSDALAMLRLGYRNVVSPSMVRLSALHLKKLEGKKINAIFDRDMGGYAGLQYLQTTLPEEMIGTLALTPNGLDVDEETPEQMHSFLRNLPAFDVRK